MRMGGYMEPSVFGSTPIPRSEVVPEWRARLLSIEASAMNATEVICPKPRRVVCPLLYVDSLSRAGSRDNGMWPMCRADSTPEDVGIILHKNDGAGDFDQSSQKGFCLGSPPVRANNRFNFPGSPPIRMNHSGYFFSGSPPVRASNPMVQDPQFIKNVVPSCSTPSPYKNSCGTKMAGRAEVGSPSCAASFSSSPKVRIEGFSCGSSDRHCAVYTFA